MEHLSKDLNLCQRLSTIMLEAGTIEKKGRNEFNKYDYIREADVAKKFQELFVKHGVFVFSSVSEAESKQVQSASGKPNILSQVTVMYTFVNVDKPEDQMVVSAVGDGMDSGDKAIYKALTGAHKYMLIRNFNLGSDEDAEKESPAVATREPKSIESSADSMF